MSKNIYEFYYDNRKIYGNEYKNEINYNNILYLASQLMGWIYFFAWSLSFYGQVIENYKRKSVKGLSFDFISYNLLGFICYTIYTIWGFLDPNIGTGKVSFQDIIFALHAVLLTLITIFQIFIYYDEKDSNQKLSSTCKLIIICLIWGILQILFIEKGLKLYEPHISNINNTKVNFNFNFNSVIYLGFCKVFISFIKYMPQAYYNYERKSTIGWNIHNILLDFTGGSFSFMQNIIDTIRGQEIINNDPYQNHSLNIAKYALSFISIIFDIIFIFQHYYLYKDNYIILNQNDNNNNDNKENCNEKEKENINININIENNNTNDNKNKNKISNFSDENEKENTKYEEVKII
jgi:cystinosin